MDLLHRKIDVILTAPTSAVADNIGGNTYHTSLGILIDRSRATSTDETNRRPVFPGLLVVCASKRISSESCRLSLPIILSISFFVCASFCIIAERINQRMNPHRRARIGACVGRTVVRKNDYPKSVGFQEFPLSSDISGNARRSSFPSLLQTPSISVNPSWVKLSRRFGKSSWLY